jgi:hypothetical protein
VWNNLPRTIHFRLTQEEYNKICERADKAGLSITHYMLAVGAYDTCLFFNSEKVAAIAEEIRRELVAQGRNYNGIAHQIHTAQLAHPDHAQVFQYLYEDIIAADKKRVEAIREVTQKLIPLIEDIGNTTEKKRRQRADY